MKNNIYEKSIIATATVTNKTENQDCKGEVDSNDFKALFIADGLGTYKYAKLSSERIIDFFVNEAKKNQGNFQEIKFSEVYKQAKQKLIAFANEVTTEEEKLDENLFGTTLISVLETYDKIKVSYTGNGAIWHIRGNFNEFPSSYLFPWSAVNILNPHTIPENGKEALYRLISSNNDYSECIPSIIELEKDNEYGEIIMICTDGIYSGDQIKAGKNDKGTWLKYEPSMLKFFEYISHYFKNNQLYNKESIEQILNQYLDEIKPMLDDDATIGILISQKTLNYQNEINWQNNEIDSGNEI
jgi:serine/threonine protein phosphatase PrpC